MDAKAIRNAALEEAAVAAEALDRAGREWVRDSLWANIKADTARAIRALKDDWCERCQGNGEIVTDWERYLHGPLDENGDDAVAACPDCGGAEDSTS
ncbi:MAG: hypothetical protein ACK40O_00990 [Allosphingosinicella sp.]